MTQLEVCSFRFPTPRKGHSNFSFTVPIEFGKYDTETRYDTEKKNSNFVQSCNINTFLGLLKETNMPCCNTAQLLVGRICSLKPSLFIRLLHERSWAKPSHALVYLKTLFNSELALLFKL